MKSVIFSDPLLERNLVRIELSRLNNALVDCRVNEDVEIEAWVPVVEHPYAGFVVESCCVL